MLKRIRDRIAAFGRGAGRYALRHKVQAGALVLVIAGLAYWGYASYQKSAVTTQYVLAFARNAPIQATVTGSGQVASEHQLDLSPKSGGTITSVDVKAGQEVVAGQIVATIDDTDARKSLRDAAANLESARISYEQSKTSDADTVEKSREAVFSTNASVYSDLANTLSGIDAVMNGDEVSGSYAVKNVYAYSQLFNDNPSLTTLRDRLLADYQTAQSSYGSAYADYNATSREADPYSTEKLAGETYDAAQAVAQAAKDLNDYLTAVKARYAPNDPSVPAVLSTHLSSSLSYLSTSNSDVSSALSAKNDLASEIQQSSAGGAATLSEESARLAYQKAANAYQDAKDNLENYVVRAPFPGTIAQVNLQKYDQAGASSAVAVLVTKEQYATLSLNEVDAANVRVGQKATLTFDAIDGLTIDGTVAEVDSVGTVSQGVVSYTVKIGFDTQDPRVLPGMTVNATIVTASKQDALVVPASAVKTQGTQSYVLVANYARPAGGRSATSTASRGRFASTTGGTAGTRSFGTGTASRAAFAARTGPTVDANATATRRVIVTTGITDGTMTEITSGLNPGDAVVSQSLNASGKTAGQAPSLLNLFGGGRRPAGAAAGGAARSGNVQFRAGGGGGAAFSGRGG